MFSLESSSNALDFLSDDGQFALRFNTSNEQLITDFDIYNDNNDAVIGLGGTIASPMLKIYPGNIQATGMLQIATTSSTMPLVFGSDTSYTFLAPDSTTAMTRFVVQSTGDNTINIPDVAGDMAVDQSNGIHFSLLQQTGSSGFPANSGTSHFYSDVSVGFTGSQSQLSSNTHLSKFTIQRNFAGNEGGLIVKGGRPGEAGNGTQNILAVHYQDVVAGDDIRYHGSTANSHSLQTKTSVNGLIDNKLNPSAISSNATSVTLKQPTTTDSTLTMGGNLLPASSSIDIGTQSSKFNNIYVSQINDTGDLVVSGDIFLGNNALDTLSMRAAIITSLSTSSSSNTIGSSTAPWGTIYTAKSVQAGIDSTSHTQPGQGTNNYTNSAQSHTIGSRSNGILKFDGYMADVYFIDGQALEPTAFGRYNTAGVWVPRKVDFTPAELRNSDFLTCSGSGFAAASPATNAFDGLTTTFAEGQDANSVITWTPPNGVAYTSSVQVWSQRLNTTASINGGPAVALNDNAITEIATGSGTINTLTITGTLNGAASLGIIEIDGDPVLNPFIWSDGLWANPTTTFTTDTSQLNKTFLSGYPATNAFDGNDSTTCIAEGAGGNWITWIGNLTNVTTLEVRSDSLQQIYVNGELASITPAAGPSAQTYTITSPPETINNISCQAQSAANARIYAITVNGQVLVDGTNPSYGVNGFHLQFADTSNIGLDTSGNGNDFTATGFDFSPVGVWSDDLFTNNFDEAVPNFNSTEKSFYVSTPADQGFNGNNANYAGTGNPGSWLFWRPTPQTVQSTIALQCNFELESIYINEVLVDWNDVQDGGGGVKINPIIPFTGTLSNLAWRGKASTFAATVAILQIDGVTYIDNLGANYDSMQDSPTQNYATINLLYPGASTSKANLTTANATGKPTILGIAGNVGVDGAAVAWDGTEAGWTSTGAINFGQQPSGFDEFSTSTMPAATIPAGRALLPGDRRNG